MIQLFNHPHRISPKHGNFESNSLMMNRQMQYNAKGQHKRQLRAMFNKKIFCYRINCICCYLQLQVLTLLKPVNFCSINFIRCELLGKFQPQDERKWNLPIEITKVELMRPTVFDRLDFSLDFIQNIWFINVR